MAVRALVFLALVAGTAGVSPVQKVLQLIDDMTVKVKAELTSTHSGFEEYAKLCDDEATAKDYAIKGTAEQVVSLEAAVEDAAAKISSAESKVEDISGSISATEAELADAIKLRAKEKADFLATEKQMLATIEELTNGVKTLKSTLELAQLTPDAKRGLDAVVASLGQVVDSDFVTHAERKRVHAFLQAKEDAEESFTLKTASPGVVEVLEGMLGRAEGTLTDTRKKEQEEAQSGALLKQSLESQIASLKEEMAETTKNKQFNAESKAATEKDLATEEKSLKQDKAALSSFKMECQERALQYEADVKDAEGELTALGKAKAILVKKFALLETQTAVAEAAHDDEDARAKALRKIERLGRKFHSTSLVALAYRLSTDPFGKVRAMVESMIAKLLKEAAEEADQKAFCDQEIGQSTKSQAQKQESLAKTQSRIDKADASIAKLSELVATLSKEVSEIDREVATATALREKEHAANMKAEEDYVLSEQACASAISVLRDYYEGAALVQTDAKARAALRGDGSGIIGVLEVAESDFAKLLADTRATEEAAAADFAKMSEENKLSKATKLMDIKGKESEVKALKAALSDYGEDKASVSSELSAVEMYLAKLKPQCETKAPSYAEVKAAREAEIQGLKEALKILSDDGAAAFAQTRAHSLRGIRA